MLKNRKEIGLIVAMVLLPLVWVILILTLVYQLSGGSVESASYTINNIVDVPNKLEPAQPATITLVAVGDIMLSRHVAWQMHQADDFTLPFKNLAPLLSQADITFGNLESPFATGQPIFEGMSFKAQPEAIAGLKLAGFDVLSLANNHNLNQGRQGLLYSLDYLNDNGILPIGAGVDFITAHQGVKIKVNDTTFGFLAYTYEPIVNYSSPVLNNFDFEQLSQDITQLKKEADIIVVSMHAGIEYTFLPNQQQQDFAHRAIEAGASLIIGHHPHVTQLVEQYNEGWIFYSLGNFVFDQEWSQETKEGLVLQAIWENKKLVSLKLQPVIIENYSTPRLATQTEAAKIFTQIDLINGDIYSAADLTESVGEDINRE
ncbi:MAG: CapA family protein [Patescibacteria group bacterium]